jgi:hypothetical protein
MVLSGIALVIFDSRIAHRFIRRIKDRFRRPQRQNVELQDNTSETTRGEEEHPEVDSIQLDSDNTPPTSLRNRQTATEEETPPESPTRVSAQHVVVSYSILTGTIVFLIFISSFIAVMVVRGVVHDASTLFKFFANMYLAGCPSSNVTNLGTIIFGEILWCLINCRWRVGLSPLCIC